MTTVASTTAPSEQEIAEFRRVHQRLGDAVEVAVHGKRSVIDLVLVATFAGGHVLLEDLPGTGKTTLARAVARALGGEMHRVQFTPDLLPSDVTGTTVFDPRDGQIRFRPGPVFANVVLADEINRAAAKTQSALLEVMEERTVTVDGTAHPVPEPFVVIATQNPIDLDGTYRLPEAQLDRFLVRTSLGYPDAEHEIEVLRPGSTAGRIDDVPVVSDPPRSSGCRRWLERLHVADPILATCATSESPSATTRGCAWVRAPADSARSCGLPAGLRRVARAPLRRPRATYSRLAEPVLAHRTVLTRDALLDGHTSSAVVLRGARHRRATAAGPRVRLTR